MGKKETYQYQLCFQCLLYGHLIFLTCSYVLQVQIAVFQIHFDIYLLKIPTTIVFVTIILTFMCIYYCSCTYILAMPLHSNCSKRCHLS